MPTEVTSIQAYFAQFFKMLEPIREVLEQTLEGWDTPVIVVFGAESAGKSTILERIAMIPIFPKGEDLCTRLPIRVKLRNAKESRNPVLVVLEKKRDGTYKAISGPGEIELSKGEDIVRKEMNDIIKKENNMVVGISQKMQIELTLEGPEYPNLDLLDMPGLVTNAKEDEPEDLKHQTHALLDAIIEETKDRAIYLLIREVGDKARNSQSLEVLKKHSFMSPWTVGVLTKCDEVRNKMILTELDEDVSEINNYQGYVATMNAPEGHQGDLHKQAKEEDAFFGESALLSLIKEGRATTNVLVGKISTLYAQYLKSSWLPITLLKIEQEIQLTTEANKSLGLPEICDATQLQEQKLHTQLASYAKLLLQATDEDISAIITQYILPLQQEFTAQFQRYTKPTNIREFELALMVNKDEKGVLLQALEKALSKAIKQIHTHKIKSAQERLEKDIVGAEPKTEFRIGRFPKYIEVLIEQAKKNDLKNYNRALQSSRNYLTQELPRFKTYDLGKETASLCSKRIKNLGFFDGLLSIIMEFSVSSFLTKEEMVSLAQKMENQDLIESCLETRIELREHQNALISVQDQLYETFEIEKTKDGYFSLLSELKSLDGLDLSGANFSGKDISGKSFQGANLTGVNFAAADLSGCNFQGAILVDVDFKGANLNKVNFQKTEIKNCNLEAAKITSAKLTGTSFIETNLKSASFSGSKLKGTKLISTKNTDQAENLSFEGLDLQDISFEGLDLSGRSFQGVILRNIDFTKANLQGAIFRNVSLTNVDFQDANLTGANFASSEGLNTSKNLSFEGLDLQGISFEGLDLSGRSFQGANLTNANFQNANLTECDFRKAILTQADLQKVDFSSINLQGARLDNSKLEGCKNWPGSLWSIDPSSFDITKDSQGLMRNCVIKLAYGRDWTDVRSLQKITPDRDYYWEVSFSAHLNNIQAHFNNIQIGIILEGDYYPHGFYLKNNSIERNGKHCGISWQTSWGSGDSIGFWLKNRSITVYQNGKKLGVLSDSLSKSFQVYCKTYNHNQNIFRRLKDYETTLHLKDLDAKYPPA